MKMNNILPNQFRGILEVVKMPVGVIHVSSKLFCIHDIHVLYIYITNGIPLASGILGRECHM